MSAWDLFAFPTFFGMLIAFVFVVYRIVDIVKWVRRLRRNPPQFSTKITVQAVSMPSRCTFCHDDEPYFQCICGAAYHIECWNELTHCATIGCEVEKIKVGKEIARIAFMLHLANKTESALENWITAEKLVLANLGRNYRSIALR